MISNSIPQPLVRTNQWFLVLCVLSAWITKQEWILAIPLIAGILGLAIDFNPVMRFAKLFLKKKPTEYIPEDRDQQQFNQVIAVICLAGSLISFFLGWDIAGYVFSAMVALAAGVALMGFCIGCFIRFQWKQYQYRQSLKKQL